MRTDTREALRREAGFGVLAAICVLLAVVAAVRVADARRGGVIEVEPDRKPVMALIDINTADAALLTTLPGVGEKMAQRIIEGRPYAEVQELLRVNGIGQATLDKFIDRITVCHEEPAGDG